jgi:energy-converting hydrogenase A subunit R
VPRPFTAAFDLEGPLSPQDNAYEVMHLIKEGPSLFEVISLYDDYLALRNKPDYEPGETLKLIVPFLLVNGITERDILNVSKGAKLVDGAKELITCLKDDAWNVHVISTSYEQHAHNIASQLGVDRENVHCTRFPLDSFSQILREPEVELVEEIQNEILSFSSTIDDGERSKFAALVTQLDEFFFEKAPSTRMGAIFNSVTVVGGQRKVQAVVEASGGTMRMHETAAIGDSITDYKMLERVTNAGGLSVAFNGNTYALPYAEIGMACIDIRPLHLMLAEFRAGGLKSTLNLAGVWEQRGHEFCREPWLIPARALSPKLKRFLLAASDPRVCPRFHVLQHRTEQELQQIEETHTNFRNFVRGRETAQLG